MSAALKNSPRMMAVFARIADERLRQQRLLAEGRFNYSAAQPCTCNFRKYVILGEEIGEVAQALDRLENGHTAAVRNAGRAELREELIQVAAVAVAWLESMEVVP
jgi:hypothetical protein